VKKEGERGAKRKGEKERKRGEKERKGGEKERGKPRRFRDKEELGTSNIGKRGEKPTDFRTKMSREPALGKKKEGEKAGVGIHLPASPEQGKKASNPFF